MTDPGEIRAAEPFGERQFYDFLNGASNHELKLLTGAVILAYPDIAFSPALQRRALSDGQGDHEAWKIETSIPKNYCINSLEPIGAVVKTTIRGEQGALVTAFEAEPVHREVRLACIGTLLGWSLEYPDMSVQQVFGTTASHTNIRAPEMRYRSYTALLTGNDGGTVKSMFTSLEGKGYPNYANMYTQLIRMQELGIIDLGTIDQNPEISMHHASYRTLIRGLENTFPAAQAAYAAIEQFGQGQTTSVNEVVDTALAINPTINSVELRTMLIDGINKKVYSDPEHIQRNPQRTAVTFAPAAKKPITELHERLEATRAGDYTGVQTAEAILDDPQAFRSLVQKARSFSHLVKGKESGRKLLETQLVNLVTTTQGQSATELRDALKAQHGREIAERSLRDVLRDLVNSGKIAQDNVPKKPYSKRSVAIFRANES